MNPVRARGVWIVCGAALLALAWWRAQPAISALETPTPDGYSIIASPSPDRANRDSARSFDRLPVGPAALAGCDIVLITLDTTRADRLGCYGHAAARTPALDRLAAAGVRCTDARAVSPVTLPAHASLLTGLYPLRHEARDNGAFRLPDARMTLAEVCSKAGYQTAAFVSSFVLDPTFGLSQGFDHYDARVANGEGSDEGLPSERTADAVTDAALAWLTRAAPDRPLFLWVHYYDPHQDYRPHADAPPNADAYDAEIAFMDAHIGRLLDDLRNRRGARRVLTIAVADHGEGLWDHEEKTHGFLAYDSTLRIPLLLSCPGVLPAGATLDRPVSQVDLLPTVLALTGMRSEKTTDGRDLTRALPADRAVYSETIHGRVNHGWAPLFSVAAWPYKFILGPRPELFDLSRDPGERVNLVDQLPGVVQRLRGNLQQHYGMHLDPDAALLANRDVSAADRRRLESLGYASGAGDAGAFPTGRPDPKEMMAPLNRLEDAIFNPRLRGDLPTRIAALERIVRAAPRFHAARQFLARSYSRLGKLEQASAEFAACLELAPDAPDSLTGLASIRARMGDLRGAAAALRRIVARYPDDLKARSNLGATFLELADYNAAIDQFRAIVDVCPDYKLALQRLAEAMARGGRDGELPGVLTPLIEREPRRTAVRIALASHLASRGEYAASESLLRDGLRIEPGDAELILQLVRLLSQCPDRAFRRPPEALALLERACAATPAAGAEARGIHEQALSLALHLGDRRLADELKLRLGHR